MGCETRRSDIMDATLSGAISRDICMKKRAPTICTKVSKTIHSEVSQSWRWHRRCHVLRRQQMRACTRSIGLLDSDHHRAEYRSNALKLAPVQEHIQSISDGGFLNAESPRQPTFFFAPLRSAHHHDKGQRSQPGGSAPLTSHPR